MKRFKKKVVIGGIEGHDAERLVDAMVIEARGSDTINETCYVLKNVLDILGAYTGTQFDEMFEKD